MCSHPHRPHPHSLARQPPSPSDFLPPRRRSESSPWTETKKDPDEVAIPTICNSYPRCGVSVSVTVAFLMKFYSVHIAVNVISAARLVLCHDVIFYVFSWLFRWRALSQAQPKKRYIDPHAHTWNHVIPNRFLYILFHFARLDVSCIFIWAVKYFYFTNSYTIFNDPNSCFSLIAYRIIFVILYKSYFNILREQVKASLFIYIVLNN